MYENRMMKPVEIILRGGGEREYWRVGLVRVHCERVRKCENETLLYN
jgi:hypothetical protein